MERVEVVPAERLAAVLFLPTTVSFRCRRRFRDSSAQPRRPADNTLQPGEPPTMLKPAAAICRPGRPLWRLCRVHRLFRHGPEIQQIPDDVAVIKVSFSHLGDRECRKRTPKNSPSCRQHARTDGLPARTLRHQGRDRHRRQERHHPPLHPTGLYKDGISTMYRRLSKSRLVTEDRGPHERQRQAGRLEIRQGGNDRSEAGAESRDRLPPDHGGLFFK